MRAFALILVVCIASTFAGQFSDKAVQEKAITDFIINTFGLQSVWAEIQTLGSNLVGQFQTILAQLLFAGQDKWTQAQALFNTLVYDLTNHIGDASSIVTQTVQALSALLQNNNTGKRDLADFFLNTLGLGSIWSEVQNVGAGLLAQFTAELTQLLFSGAQVLAQAKPILQQLASDLQNHLGNSSTILTAAVAQLAQLLNNGGKRDLADFFLNTLGLGSIWSEIQNVGSGLLAQFTAELTQLLFSGAQVLAQAKPILQQLASDLQNHLGNSSTILTAAVAQLAQLLNNSGKRDLADFFLNQLGLGNIWSEIQNVGSGLLAQFTAELTQLLFSGAQVLAQAKPILQQLASDLQNHLGNSSTILTAAVAQLAQLLSNSGKRGVTDFIINTFGLQSVWAEIQTLGSNLVGQFQTILAQLLFAGQDKWTQAQALFNTLVYDLTNHIGDASSIVTQTVQALSALLQNNNTGRRGLKQLIQ